MCVSEIGVLHVHLQSVAWQPNFDKETRPSQERSGGVRGGAMDPDGNRLQNSCSGTTTTIYCTLALYTVCMYSEYSFYWLST